MEQQEQRKDQDQAAVVFQLWVPARYVLVERE